MKKELTIYTLLTAFLLLCGVSLHAETSHTGKVGDEVIAHYARLGDKEKLKAAKFLVENMRYHYFYESGLLADYYRQVHEVSQQYKYPTSIQHYQNIYKKLGDIGDGKQKIYDNDRLTAKFLIKHIDDTFTDWKQGRWDRHLSFDEFCEYILPYRLGNERFEDCRQALRNQFFAYATVLTDCDERRHSAYWAARSLCDGLKAFNFKVDDKALPHSDVDLPMSVLMDMKMGECSNYAKLTTYIMRSCGIPVSYDYTLQWPNKAFRHSWNALHDNTGQTVPFLGSETYPGQSSRTADKMAKVFRRTFAYQTQSLYALNEKWGELLPPTLSSPFFTDVSEEYFKGANVTFTLPAKQLEKRTAYLAVFDNQDWIPVAWSVIDSGRQVTFRSMGREIVYMPVLWGRNGSVPCGNPFLLQSNGSIKSFSPDMSRKITLTLNRKYPLFGRMLDYAHTLKGGYIEASDSANFKDAVRIADITKTPSAWYNAIKVDVKGRKFRYWRYKAPNGSKGNLAEMELYCLGKELPASEAMGDDMRYNKAKAKKIIDKDKLSYYESLHARGAWAGVDMGEPVAVDEIRFLPRNDGNHVESGHIYQLCYFDKGKQVAVGTVTATDSRVVFRNVPSGTLYILHDLTAGSEERVFSCENGEIEWY